MLGEKIAFYRKKNNLSQEELANALNVTRQSISLWETDQSMPSMDNLIRLSEIFKISMDELCDKKNIERETENYISKGETSFDKQHITKVYFHLNKTRIIIFIIAFVLNIGFFIGSLLTNGFNDSHTIISLITLVVIAIILFRIIYVIKRTINTYIKECYPIKNTYYFYDEYVQVNSVMKNGNSSNRFYYRNIKKKEISNGVLYLLFDNSFIAIKLQVLSSSERIIEKLQLYRQKKLNTKNTAIEALLLILFILSICSIFFGLMAIAISRTLSPYPDNLGSMIEHIYLFYLFLPIPLSSLILGIIYIHKGYRCKKNIIVGIIMSILLFIYGSIGSSFRDRFSHDYSHIKQVGEIVSFGLPNKGYTSIENLLDESIILSVTEFDKSDNKDLKARISKDIRWKDSISFIPADMVSPFYLTYISRCEYYCVYDINSGKYNEIQSQSNHEYILLGYDIEEQQLIIMELVY